MATDGHARAGAVILVGGHENDGGRSLPELDGQRGLAGLTPQVAAPGRSLEQALERALASRDADQPVVVVPMTLGRDPRLVSDTARTVRWAARGEHAGAIALAPPFGTADHLVSWLRAACRRLRDDDAAILISARAADPFDDAELYRIAALVRTHGTHAMVEVGLRATDGGLADGLERCRRLGATRIVVVPADFGVPEGADGPLLSASAVAPVVAARVATALHRLARHGDDGVATAHDADHQHGFAHSHGDDDTPGHDHGHGGHAQGHAHGDAPDHDHDHGHGGHDHAHAPGHADRPVPAPGRGGPRPAPDPTDSHAHDHLAVG